MQQTFSDEILALKAEQTAIYKRQQQLHAEIQKAHKLRLETFRILMVAGSSSDAEFAVEMFNQTGLSVEIKITDGFEDALTLLRTLRPDIILLDINLPDVDGGDFLTLLLLDCKVRQIDVYLISGLDIDEMALKIQPKEFIKKPIDVDTATKMCKSCRR